jgi:hypothetical protein
MDLSDQEYTALDGGSFRIGFFFRLATDPVVRLWLGVGKIAPGVNAIDLTGAVYTGFGEIVNVPAFRQLINGQAERVEFTLSGVSEQIIQIASQEDAPNVRGKDCALGFALMGNTWQLLGPIRWIRRYTADFLAVRQTLTDNPDQPIVRTVTLSVGSLMTGRRRPGLSYFTDQDQRRRSAGSPVDRFCERTVLYTQERRKSWPTIQ